MARPILRNSISEKTPDSRELSVNIEAIFDVNFFSCGFGVVNDAHDHFIRVLSEHRKHIGAECNIGVDTGTG